MKKILNFILYSISLVVVLGLLLLFLAPSLPFLGNYEVRIVKSGSMEPSIMTGSVVLVKEEANYQMGDVITFSTKGGDIPTSHRIIDTENRGGDVVFKTKGDANEDADIALVSPVNILGKVVLSLPYLGFILDFARQPLGFALLIGIPALIIVMDEIENIWKELRRGKSKEELKEELDVLVIAPYQPGFKTGIRASHVQKDRVVFEDEKKSKSPASPRAMSAFVVAFSLITVSLWGNDTVSYYSSEFLTKANNFQAQALDFALAADKETVYLNGEGLGEDAALVSVVKGFEVDNELDFDVKAQFKSGDLALCQEIFMETDLPLSYTGKVLGFEDINNKMNKDFNMTFSLNDEASFAYDTECAVEFLFKGFLSGVEENRTYVVEKDLVMEFVVKGEEAGLRKGDGFVQTSSTTPTSSGNFEDEVVDGGKTQAEGDDLNPEVSLDPNPDPVVDIAPAPEGEGEETISSTTSTNTETDVDSDREDGTVTSGDNKKIDDPDKTVGDDGKSGDDEGGEGEGEKRAEEE